VCVVKRFNSRPQSTDVIYLQLSDCSRSSWVSSERVLGDVGNLDEQYTVSPIKISNLINPPSEHRTHTHTQTDIYLEVFPWRKQKTKKSKRRGGRRKTPIHFEIEVLGDNDQAI
jgi:hypothetical protein